MTDPERISALETRVAQLEALVAAHWPKKLKSRPDVQEIAAYCVTQGLPASDGEAVLEKWNGTGWLNGGFPIKDWKATIRSWKLHGYMPSQKQQNGNGTHPNQRRDNASLNLDDRYA